MYRIVIIILLSFYSFGTLLCPLGDMAYIRHLPDMYEQCSHEDPDMDAVDFVFEHLLNFGDVMSHFEQDPEEHEKPHAPFEQIQPVQQLVTIITSMQFEYPMQAVVPEMETIYPCYNSVFLPSNYLAEIFHPPSA